MLQNNEINVVALFINVKKATKIFKNKGYDLQYVI